MSGKAAKITLTEKQLAILEQIKRPSRTTIQRLVQRATVILMAFTGALNDIKRMQRPHYCPHAV